MDFYPTCIFLDGPLLSQEIMTPHFAESWDNDARHLLTSREYVSYFTMSGVRMWERQKLYQSTGYSII